jgi:hypothetical protein
MGANASVKAGANVSAFESATFALRGWRGSWGRRVAMWPIWSSTT